MANNQSKLVESSELLTSSAEQEISKSPEYVSVYANNVQVSISAFDFSLSFGEITGATPQGNAKINQKARVILSKEMAKVLTTLLTLNISAYEQNFGEIKLPNIEAASAVLEKPMKVASKKTAVKTAPKKEPKAPPKEQ